MINTRYIKNVLCMTSVICVLYSFNSLAYSVEVPKGVSIKGIELGGMDKNSAKNKVNEILDKIENKNIEVDINNNKLNINTKDIDISILNKNDIYLELDNYTQGNIINRYVKSQQLSVNPKELSIDIDVDNSKLNRFVDDNTKDLIGSAVDASIKREGSKFIITDSKDGISIDKKELKNQIIDVVNSLDSTMLDDSILVTANTVVEKAKVSTADLESIKDIIGTYTTDFSSSSAARATNVENGTAKINGHLLLPGETLSGYECLKPFTIANGYKIAHAYENGAVVDSVGGGACQIATTLYNASLRAEIDITQRQNHSMIVGYVPASCDAAIAGTYKDIKITNNYDTPIYVEGITNNRKVTFNIWGKENRDKNRQIKFVSEVLSETPAGITYVDDPTLPIGKEKKDASGHKGRRSRLWKIETVNGVEVNKTLVSTDNYRMSNAIYKRGTMPAPEVNTVDAVDTTPVNNDNVENIANTNNNTNIIGPGANLPSVEPKNDNLVPAPNIQVVPQGPTS